MPKRKDPDSSWATPPKKATARKKAKASPQAKRTDWAGKTVRFSLKPSVKVQERIERAQPGSSHRLYLLDRKVLAPPEDDDGPSEDFVVLGATGNVYTVTIGQHPKCTCPDALKGNLCKHHLFVMLRVLGLPQDNVLVWQKGLLKPEAAEVLNGMHSTREMESALAENSVRDAYRRHIGGNDGAQDAAANQGQRPVEGHCPICFDKLVAGQDAVVFCAACGNNVHSECFSRWSVEKRRKSQPVTCIYCRANWAVEDAGDKTDGLYTNLKHASTMHAEVSLEGLYGSRSMLIGGGRRGVAQYLSLQGL